MRKVLAVAGAAAGLVVTGAGAAAAHRQRRRQRFYADVLSDLGHALTFYRARVGAAAHNQVEPETALAFLSNLPGFSVSQDELHVDVDVELPDNRDVSKMAVTISGSSAALHVLRDRLLAEKGPQVSAEGIGTVNVTTTGGELKFLLMVGPGDNDDTHIVYEKLLKVD
jgi:hypothetical protein